MSIFVTGCLQNWFVPEYLHTALPCFPSLSHHSQRQISSHKQHCFVWVFHFHSTLCVDCIPLQMPDGVLWNGVYPVFMRWLCFKSIMGENCVFSVSADRLLQSSAWTQWSRYPLFALDINYREAVAFHRGRGNTQNYWARLSLTLQRTIFGTNGVHVV